MPPQPSLSMQRDARSVFGPPQVGTDLASTGRSRPLVLVWLARIRARRALAGLHRDQMREAGLDPHTVRDAAMRPFWRA